MRHDLDLWGSAHHGDPDWAKPGRCWEDCWATVHTSSSLNFWIRPSGLLVQIGTARPGRPEPNRVPIEAAHSRSGSIRLGGLAFLFSEYC